MAGTMRRWEMNSIGRDRLELRDVAIPTPRRGEILVDVAAVSLNHRDKMVIESGRGLPLAFPFTPGSDLAGKVVARGEGVSRFSIGDDVISTFTPGWLDGIRQGDARGHVLRKAVSAVGGSPDLLERIRGLASRIDNARI